MKGISAILYLEIFSIQKVSYLNMRVLAPLKSPESTRRERETESKVARMYRRKQSKISVHISVYLQAILESCVFIKIGLGVDCSGAMSGTQFRMGSRPPS